MPVVGCPFVPPRVFGVHLSVSLCPWRLGLLVEAPWVTSSGCLCSQLNPIVLELVWTEIPFVLASVFAHLSWFGDVFCGHWSVGDETCSPVTCVCAPAAAIAVFAGV